MRFRSLGLIAASLTLATAPQLPAQRVVDITVEILDRLLRGYETEQTELAKVDVQLKSVDDKLQKYRACRSDWELAARAAGSAVSGLAASIAIRAKCGASSESGILNERNKITEGPENAGAKAGGFKLSDYVLYRDRVMGYLRGERNGFSKGSLDLLASRESELSGKFGIVVAAAPSSGPRTVRVGGMWTTDYAWAYIGQLFAIQYMSGATMFEKTYRPGEWTNWQITEADSTEERQSLERAFLFATPDSSEWWRLKTITTKKVDGKDVADTVTLEALFKPLGESIKQLVRMRGKLPGSAEPQELIVPQAMAMLSLAGAFPFKPTPESVAGATIGTETIRTPAGSFSARHVRFGGGRGTLDWWLDDTAPGGWVKFSTTSNDKKETWRMEMVGKGTGATSETGVKM